jgi:spermidine synthase
MDMTDPFGPSRMLYTSEFFRHVAAALRDERGVFSMHSESPVARPVAYRCIGKTLQSVFPTVRHAYSFIKMYATYWSFAVAGRETDIASVDARSVQARLSERNIGPLHVIDGASWSALQNELPYVRAIPNGVPVITDERPVFPDHFSSTGGIE